MPVDDAEPFPFEPRRDSSANADTGKNDLRSHHVVPNGVLNQFGVAFGAKHFHDPVLVVGHGSSRHVQDAADFLHDLALRQQL